MEFLSLQSNYFTGPIPGELGLMTNLGECLTTFCCRVVLYLPVLTIFLRVA